LLIIGYNYTITAFYRIGVSVLASSAVDRRVKPKIIKLVFVASPLSMQH